MRAGRDQPGPCTTLSLTTLQNSLSLRISTCGSQPPMLDPVSHKLNIKPWRVGGQTSHEYRRSLKGSRSKRQETKCPFSTTTFLQALSQQPWLKSLATMMFKRLHT